MTDRPAPVDHTQPSIARVYDYLLGGRDNYAVDREIGDFFIKDLPGSQAIAFTNRQAMIRAVGEIARSGVRQFIDFGSGLPTADNVHQVAQRYLDAPRVVYVDNDPIVLAHGRALLAEDDNTVVVRADLREPESILNTPELQRLIDFDQPVALLFSAVLHHLNDDEKPGELVAWWTRRIVSGSQVYISSFRSGSNEETRVAEAKLQSTFGRGRWRSDEELLQLFGDLEVLDPGLQICSRWHAAAAAPDVARIGPDEREPTVWERLISCALARKP